LLGIEPSRYEQWKSSTNAFLKQFQLSSNVLQASLSQADAAALSSIVDFSIPSLSLASPTTNQLMRSASVTCLFSVSNIELGGTDGYQIRVQVDGGLYTFSSTEDVDLTGLSDGVHTLEAVLVKNEVALQNSEALVQTHFIVQTSASADNYIQVDAPVPNQRFSTGSLTVYFTSNWPEDFFYVLDDGAPVEVSSNPFSLSGLASGDWRGVGWLDGRPVSGRNKMGRTLFGRGPRR